MLYEAAHQIALVPILIVLLAGRGLPRAYWWLAGAFTVSWVWDSVIGWRGGAWEVFFLFLPLQMGLAVAAFRRHALIPALIVFYALAIVGLGLGPPDVLVTLLGSGTVVALALRSEILTAPVVLYFGIGTLCYLGMIQHLDGDGFMRWWYPYQGARAAAFGAFGWEVWRVREAA